MARLYRYVDSSPAGETQYYILDKGRQKPITIQVYGVANKLFDHLKYEPGVRGNKSEEGDRLPRSLMYALYDRGLIGTDGEEELTEKEVEDIINYDGEDPVLMSEGDIQVLKNLLIKYGGLRLMNCRSCLNRLR